MSKFNAKLNEAYASILLEAPPVGIPQDGGPVVPPAEPAQAAPPAAPPAPAPAHTIIQMLIFCIG